jgi:outer membrane receptor protein involved in Fe transport
MMACLNSLTSGTVVPPTRRGSDMHGLSDLSNRTRRLPFFVVDAHVHFKLDKQWSAALGIDNLNNYKYWAFHPYTQRTVVAELKFDL